MIVQAVPDQTAVYYSCTHRYLDTLFWEVVKMEHERAEAHLQYAEKDGSHIRQSIQAKLSYCKRGLPKSECLQCRL